MLLGMSDWSQRQRKRHRAVTGRFSNDRKGEDNAVVCHGGELDVICGRSQGRSG